jgi:hypothetical protein
MQVHWQNIVALMLAIGTLTLFLKYPAQISGFLASMQLIGPGHDPDEQTLGLIAFGLVAISLVAIVRLLTQNKK